MTENLCAARTRAGGECRHPAGYGTDHVGFGRCKFHLGSTQNLRAAAAREEAEAAVAKLGLAIETDPHEALAAGVAILAGQVRFLQAKVRAIDEGQELEDGGALAPVVRTLNGVVDQWTRIAKSAVDAGVAERQVALDEMQVGRVATVIRAVLNAAGLDDDQAGRARAELAAQLASLDVFSERRLGLTA
jgi:hypothetical protein